MQWSGVYAPGGRRLMRFSDAFGIKKSALATLGCFDPLLESDTRKFLDPLLFSCSEQEEFRVDAREAFEQRFSAVSRLLAASKRVGDVPWRSAVERFKFPEVSGTCLGYGRCTTKGAGMGPKIRDRLLSTAKEIVDLGVVDPEIFPLLALLEEGVGADRISDMATNIALDAIGKFTERVCSELGIPSGPYMVEGRQLRLPTNPANGGPLMLVASDVLRELPIAVNWSGLAAVAAENAQIRRAVNEHISHLFAKTTERSKAALRREAIADPGGIRALVGAARVSAVELGADDALDGAGVGAEAAASFPLTLGRPSNPNEAVSMVRSVLDHFSDVVENKGLARVLWHRGKPREERTAQALFYGMALAYCKASNLDISPEVDHGRGPVDFKFSKGFDQRVLVELKLSTNKKLVSGYTKQLEIYKKAADSTSAFYVVLHVGGSDGYQEKLVALRNDLINAGKRASHLLLIDGMMKVSASRA